MKLAKYGIAVFIALSAVLASVSVMAQQEGMTDAHIARIKSNCKEALGTIATIHANDAPMYVNHNQTYFSIGDKMMARFNSRLSINHFEASELVKTASDYDIALDNFRVKYKLYDDTMADLLRMDCTKQPVSFYDRVAEARERRREVNQSVQELKALIDGYQESIQRFRVDNAERLTGVSS